MQDLNFTDMQNMQKNLQKKHAHDWTQPSPAVGRDFILWMIGEIGETADVIKKKGDQAIMDDDKIRRHFIEEMADVMMYFNDICLCYSISPEEISQAYIDKHEYNMNRDFSRPNQYNEQ